MHKDTLTSMEQIAQETAAKGIKIFPFDPIAKMPYQGFTKWQERATIDPKQVRQWWTQWPEAMIAAPTGHINGFFVFDVDTNNGKTGLESLRKLEEKHGPLPATMVVRTPSGGLHFYFKMPPDCIIKNSESKIAPYIDVRGDGGCIIWPGSVRPNGKYEIITDWKLQ